LGGDGGGGSWYFAHGLDYGIREGGQGKKKHKKEKSKGENIQLTYPPLHKL